MFDEYNDYEEYENNGYEKDIQEAAERAREAMIAKSVEMNYNHITGKGFLAKDLKDMTARETDQVQETIEYMIAFYEEREIYERCAILMKALNAVKSLNDFEPVADIY